MAPSAWWQHVPIAHWLVTELKPPRIVELGTHYGVSFFSFCEAAQAFSPDTFIYAVDTWEGDEHSSFYEDSVFMKVEKHWERTHRLRSRLVRSKFDDATRYFEDGSIDILHIDGLHTYEAVKHDYETWLPKMNREHVILFHDINVRERGFGVWRLWEELKTANTTYEVLNGHGLGILVNGEDTRSSFENFSALVKALQSKGELLEKIANLTPGGSFGANPIEQAKAEVEQARAEAEQARAESKKFQQELESMRSSRFWKISRPTRKFLDRIRTRQIEGI